MKVRYVVILCGFFFILGGILGALGVYEYFKAWDIRVGGPSYSTIQSYYDFSGRVTRIIDGDTLEVDGRRIRLALVDTPERGMPGFYEAAQFTASLCPVGLTAYIDVDDGQPVDKYGRVVAVVYCGGKNLNAELLKRGLAEIDERFLSVSEFDPYSWT